VNGWSDAYTLHTAAAGQPPSAAQGFDQNCGSWQSAMWRAMLTVPREAQAGGLRQVLKLLYDVRDEELIPPGELSMSGVSVAIHRTRFITESIASLPYSRRWEVLHVLEESAKKLDHRGVSALSSAEGRRGLPEEAYLFVRLCGLWMLVMLRLTLRLHYQVTNREMTRFSEAPLNRFFARPLRPPETNSAIERCASAASAFCESALRRVVVDDESGRPKRKAGRTARKGANSAFAVAEPAWSFVVGEVEAAMNDDAIASTGISTKGLSYRQLQADEENSASDSDDDDPEERAERAKLARIRARFISKKALGGRAGGLKKPRLDFENLVSSDEEDDSDDLSSSEVSSDTSSESEPAKK